MKKQLVLAAMAVLTLASCSKEVVINDAAKIDGAISFRPFATKASVTWLADVDSLNVQAIKKGDLTKVYFADYFLKETGTPTEYRSTDDYYWPADNDSLYFDVYYPVSPAYDVAARKITFTPAEKIADQVDLLVATTGGDKKNNNDGVALTLKHALSQIKVSAKKTDGNYKVTIKSLKIMNIKEGEKYAFKTGEWSYTSNLVNYTSEAFTTDVELALGNNTGNFTVIDTISACACGSAMIVPQQPTVYHPKADTTGAGITADPTNTDNGAYLSLEIVVEDSKGNQLFPAATASNDQDLRCAIPFPAGTNWEAGMVYHYLIDFSGNAVGLYDPNYSIDSDLAGTPIMSAPIFFKDVQITPWDYTNGDTGLDLKDFQ